MRICVYNAEPVGFSLSAKDKWSKLGRYFDCALEQMDQASLDEITVLIVRLANRVGKEYLNKFKNLSHIISATTGTDHIDLIETHTRGIKVLSLKGEDAFIRTISSTAELTWGLLIALMRRIQEASNDVKAGYWRRDLFKGYQLKGKTIGIIGLGRIGSMVANYADAFGMKVLYYDPYFSSDQYEKVEVLMKMLEMSDILSVHVHLNKETEGMLDIKVLKSLKRGSYFINTSRGRIVDESALATLLKEGHLAGIATDVLCTELDGFHQSPLYEAYLEGYNIIITPHIGGASYDAMEACELFMIDKFKSLLEI